MFLGKYLSGLVSTPQETFMDVSLTQLRPVKVVVLGQVNAPGPHFEYFGLSIIGSLCCWWSQNKWNIKRNQNLQNNKLYKTIDLYDYITKGKLKEDVRLTNNDIVFVDTRKNTFHLQRFIIGYF